MLKDLKALPIGAKVTFGETFSGLRPATPVMAVPVAMLTNSRMIPAMVTASDNRAFDVYFALLAIASRGTDEGGNLSPEKGVRERELDGINRIDRMKGSARRKGLQVDMDWVARQVGIGGMPKLDYRRQITKALRKLEDRYGLIKCEFKHGKSPEVTLRVRASSPKDEGGNLKPEEGAATGAREGAKREDDGRAVRVPARFFTEGWMQTLSLKAKFLYMVSLRQRAASNIRPWWTENMAELVAQYGVHERTWCAAIRELERREILEVARAPVPKGGKGPRQPNRYLVWPLPSQEELAKAWQKLGREMPAEVLKVARECAEKMDRPDDVETVRSFARLIGKYGEARVKWAVEKVAAMHPANPYRTMRYLVGILKSEEAKAGAQSAKGK